MSFQISTFKFFALNFSNNFTIIIYVIIILVKALIIFINKFPIAYSPYDNAGKIKQTNYYYKEKKSHRLYFLLRFQLLCHFPFRLLARGYPKSRIAPSFF